MFGEAQHSYLLFRGEGLSQEAITDLASIGP